MSFTRGTVLCQILKYDRTFQSCALKGTYRTIPGVFTPGITLQRTAGSSVRHLFPYTEFLEVLSPMATIPGVPVQHFCTRPELL